MMESNGTYSSTGSGMLGLEMSLHHVPPQQNPHPPMVSSYITHDVDYRQQSQRGGGNKPKTTQGFTLSDDDEGPTPDQISADDDGKTKMCQWQRMKWTDKMVKVLIMVVYYIGDEVGSDNNDPGGNNKKKGGGVMQKKGKWKSVSRAMMERGFYVSPQQCEDKFNDLNKRYKRVNDIIGKGTACKVVENQSLLEKLDYLSANMKEEAKKLLNSKHLFFREMCAYHSTCGHASDPTSQPNNHQQRFLHSSENVSMGPNLERAEVEGMKIVKLGSGEEEKEDEDSEEDEEEDEEGSRRQDQTHEEEEEEEDMIIEERSRKRIRKTECWSLSTMQVQQLTEEIRNVCEDGTRSRLEKRRWIKARAMQLEEQRVEYQCEAFELKWEKFSSKKEREREREKIMIERKKLENERMVVMLHKKELELVDP